VTTQDEELVVTERSRGLPSPPEVIELLDGDFTSAGYEIDDVSIDTAVRPPRIAVIVDGDTAVDLDAIADLSRLASDRLDALPGITERYVLEVSTRGVDRPLTEQKHFRRASGRKVDLQMADGSELTGRIVGVTDGALRLLVRDRADWAVRELSLVDITKAVVQVEFASPGKREMELMSQAGKEARA
jgi:ribosome maturation factor RimP